MLRDYRSHLSEKHFFVALFFITLSVCSQGVKAQQVSDVLVSADQHHVSWMANGMEWHASIERDEYFGEQTPIISIDLETGNETKVGELGNCYYRGTLSDSEGNPVDNTQAFIDLCDGRENYFTGFVGNANGVYTIEEDPNNPGELLMQLDDPMTPLTTPNETNADNNGGDGKILVPDSQEPRNSTPDKFPSVEIFVEPSFVATFGDPGYVHRIASTLAFANFIYQQSGLRQINLISINLLSAALNSNGGQGNVRHQLERLRRGTVQTTSGDVSMLMVGGDIDSTYLWGWAIEANACELQIAVNEGEDIHTRGVGRSAAFTIDLPSLIQRGWIFAHEFAHVIGANKHIVGDPLMDGWFNYINTLSEYVAGCAATTQLYKSCAYDPKTKKVTDFYSCPE